MEINLLPLAHNQLEDIVDIPKYSSEDDPCLKELHDVLKKFGKEHRFGITLLHKHFDLNENEILVETIDVEKRILTTKPVTINDEYPNHLVQTTWCFSDDPVFKKSCESMCPTDSKGRHFGYRDHL